VDNRHGDFDISEVREVWLSFRVLISRFFEGTTKLAPIVKEAILIQDILDVGFANMIE
jgi:hypothetical protein